MYGKCELSISNDLFVLPINGPRRPDFAARQWPPPALFTEYARVCVIINRHGDFDATKRDGYPEFEDVALGEFTALAAAKAGFV